MLVNLGKDKVTQPTEVSDEVYKRARNEYRETVVYLRNKGIAVTEEMANKIKADIIQHQKVQCLF